MVHFLQQYSNVAIAGGREKYVARAYAARRPDGMWDGWFVFFPLDGGPELATGCETTQGTLAQVKYWAEAISTVYLQGAVQRARAKCREALLGRRAERAEQQEALAKAAAAAYEESAALARAAATRAKHERRDAEREILLERATAARAAAMLQARIARAARAESVADERYRPERPRRAGDRRSAPADGAPPAGLATVAHSSPRRRG